jgi:hypothetical protein
MKAKPSSALRWLAAAIAVAALLAACGGDKTYTASDLPYGIDDPANARQFFSDENLDAGDGSIGNTYEFVHERKWDAAGWRALARGLDTATTDADFILEPSRSESKSAALIVSRILRYIPERADLKDLPALLREKDAGDAAQGLAHILTTYAVAFDVDGSIQVKPNVWNPVAEFAGGDLQNVPILQRHAAAPYLRLAMATDDGFAELRTGFNDYRARKLTYFADRVRSGKADDDNPYATAIDAIGSDIAVEEAVLEQIRKDPTRTRAQRNARVNAWIEAGTDVFNRIDEIDPGTSDLRPDGKTLTGVISRDAGFRSSTASEALDKKAPRRQPGDPTLADDAALAEWYLFAMTIDRAGMWRDADALDVVRPSGALIPWDDLRAQPKSGRDAFLHQLNDRDVVEGFGPIEGLYHQLYGPFAKAAAPIGKR